jgi:triacylglycerol lipase
MVCYVLRAKDLTVLVFRGTDDPFDWVANADDRSFAMKNGAMHLGFWDAYQRLKPQLTEYLIKDEPKFVWVTGHSLGGALAGICAFNRELLDQRFLTGVVYIRPTSFCRSEALPID